MSLLLTAFVLFAALLGGSFALEHYGQQWLMWPVGLAAALVAVAVGVAGLIWLVTRR